jgi:hypothetical protein
LTGERLRPGIKAATAAFFFVAVADSGFAATVGKAAVAAADPSVRKGQIRSAPVGSRIIVAAWAGNVLFAATVIPAALGVETMNGVSIGMSLGLFAVSLLVWTWAFAVALARTTRGDDVVVASLFLVAGPVPRAVRLHLFGALGVCLVITATTAAAEPFGVLVPMLPLGLAGLWGARYGTFPPRRRSGGPVGRGSSGRGSTGGRTGGRRGA